MWTGKKGHLTTTDAEFVDVIHTDGGVFGFPVALGHVDFFPNGGFPLQPGCDVRELLRTNLIARFGECVMQTDYYIRRRVTFIRLDKNTTVVTLKSSSYRRSKRLLALSRSGR